MRHGAPRVEPDLSGCPTSGRRRPTRERRRGNRPAGHRPARRSADVDDIDLDAPVGDAEGEVREEAEETEEREPLAPWQPPKGEEVNEHVRPHLEALDTIAKDEAQRNEIVGIYQQMVEAQTTRLAELNKNAKAEMVSNLKAELGDGFAGFKRDVNAAFQGLPEELRGALRSARLPDGRLLMGMPEAVRMIHGLSAKQNRHADWRADEAKRGDRTHMLQQELAELDTIMNRDIDEYHRPWRNTGKSGANDGLSSRASWPPKVRPSPVRPTSGPKSASCSGSAPPIPTCIASETGAAPADRPLIGCMQYRRGGPDHARTNRPPWWRV